MLKRLWASVIGYLNVWQQLADAHAENVRLGNILSGEQLAHMLTTDECRDAQKELRFRKAEIVVYEADAAEHARDAQSLTEARAAIASLESSNNTLLSKYRAACEENTHLKATREHYRKIFGAIDSALHPEAEAV